MPSTFRGISNNTHPSWWRDPGMRAGMVRIIICYLAVYSLGYDGSLLNGIQALPTWNRDFDNPKGYTLGLIAAAYYLPKIPAPAIIAFIIDRYGRKPCIIAGAVFMVAGALLGGLCQTYAQLVGSRIILGVGTATSQIAAATMIPELAHPRIRHMCSSFLHTMFYVGSIFAAWLTFAMVYFPGDSSWSWKIPSLVQGFGPVLLLSAFILPESPRWLMKKGREEEAQRILARFHANGEMEDELVLLQIREIKAALEMESISQSSKWIDFVRNKPNRRRAVIIILIALATQFAGNGVVQYFLVPVLRQVGIVQPAQTAGINGGLAIWNWFISMLGASLVEKVGRRKLALFSISGMLFFFVFITGLSAGYDVTRNPSMGVAIVPFIFLFMGCYSVCLTPMPYLYLPEISPLSMRAKSLALFTTTVNVCLVYQNFVNPIALAALGWKYYFFFVGTLALFLVGFYFLLRETRGMTVEESAMVYEDDATRAQARQIEQEQAQADEKALADEMLEDGKGSVQKVEHKI